MKKFLILALLTLIISTSCSLKSSSSVKTGSEYTGLLYFSGLTDLDYDNAKDLYKYYPLNFQMENPDKGQKIKGWFLNIKDKPEFDTLNQYWGKCVKAYADKTENVKDYYDRSTITLNSIEEVDLSVCGADSYVDEGNVKANLKGLEEAMGGSVEKLTFKGTLTSFMRPEPDIAYDYSLKLDEKYKDTENASGLEQLINQIIVSPSTNEIWKDMISKLGQSVEVSGYFVWGFAESKYFVIESIK